MLYFVVEGKTDSSKLKSIFSNCQTIETNGSEISKQTILLIKKISLKNTIIVFTDPDLAGKKIRQKIIEVIPNLKHVFIKKEKATKSKKVGVAQASVKNILEAVNFVVEFNSDLKTPLNSWENFVNFGYVGKSDSKEKRIKLCKMLNIPYANSKTLYKWINMIGHKL